MSILKVYGQNRLPSGGYPVSDAAKGIMTIVENVIKSREEPEVALKGKSKPQPQNPLVIPDRIDLGKG